MTLSTTCALTFIRSLAMLALAVNGLTGCLTLRSKSDVTNLNQVYTVKAGQSLQVRDTAGRVLSKQLGHQAAALLYEQQDTLLVRFAPRALPVADADPTTLDQGDSVGTVFVHYPKVNRWPEQVNPWFRYHAITFDVDLFTVLFKYRFGQPQRAGELLNTTTVGAYLGVRYDRARYRTIRNQFSFRSETRPLSVGLGGFLSLNPTTVNEYNTAGRFAGEYEALGISYGLASIFGYRSITAGLALGLENLADANNPIWVYRNKPWLGLTIGLNIN